LSRGILTSEAISRIGTEAAFELISKVENLRGQGRSILNLGVGQPNFKTPENIVDAAVKALKDGHHGYASANGIIELREAVSEDVEKRLGAFVNPDNILIVPGGRATIFFAILMFGELGAEIIYPNPSFPIYESVIRFSGSTPVPFVLSNNEDFSFKAENVLSKITSDTRLIIINSPSNPTGGIITKQEMQKLAEGLENYPNIFILSDEIYSRIMYDDYEHVSPIMYENLRDRTILLDGWSKTYAMTGWRLGYGIWPSSLIKSATRLAINSQACVNVMTQYAGLEAIKGDQSSVDMMVKSFSKRRDIMIDGLNALKGVSCMKPYGAYYAFANIKSTGYSSQELQNMLLDEIGVVTVSGTGFGVNGEGYLRFSYAASEDEIVRAISRISAFL
jgi:aspartate/methionine/tyrosine aminotransferase